MSAVAEATTTALALSHFAWVDQLVPESRAQEPGADFKPRGLWVSVDGEDDWPSWCKAEEFRDTDAQTRFRVELADDANILHLSSVDELVAFTDEYGGTPDWLPTRPRHQYIRWADVASKYQGIIIAPYSWQARNGLFWYYGWDCASGCIWDAAAIKAVTR